MLNFESSRKETADPQAAAISVAPKTIIFAETDVTFDAAISLL